MPRYPISFEIGGKLGMFKRPDSGSDGCSYAIPPASAAFNMTQSICRIVGVDIIIAAIGICNPTRWVTYSFNSKASNRKSNLVKNKQSCQIVYTVLENPRFQILGYAVNNNIKHPKHLNTNNAHSFQEQFNRRLSRGIYYRMPCLGLNQFVPNYLGHPITPIRSEMNMIFPSMIHGDYNKKSYYSDIKNNKPIINFEIKNGVAKFTDDEIIVENGIIKLKGNE